MSEKNDNVLIKLKDGALLDIKTKTKNQAGCPTCDYGSTYTYSIALKMTKDTYVIDANKMYDFAYSCDDLIKLFLENWKKFPQMTEYELVFFIYDKIVKSENARTHRLNGFNISFTRQPNDDA